MSTGFYKIPIKSVQKNTPDCVVIELDMPADLRETFRFTAGQHLTIKKELGSGEVRRNYSLCSSPLDNAWRFAVKRVEGGLFSSHANGELCTGDLLEVMPPAGKFVSPGTARHYLAVAAGSGITPLLSIIRQTLATEPGSHFTLIYANRDRSTIIFREELEAIKNKYVTRFSLHHILSRESIGLPIYEGRIDEEKCDQLFTHLVPLQTVDEFFICGPIGLITTLRNYLQQHGVAKSHIHFELFTSGDQPTIAKREPTAEPVANQAVVTVKLDGHELSFTMPNPLTSILDAALKQGADLPYACKGGVCCTCKARLVSGRVSMDVNYGLEEEEVAAGYILTCQSHPLTQKVVVDFDDR